MKNVRVILFFCIAVGFVACSTKTPQQIKDSVTLADGTVSGSFDESTGITTFKGIPFAAPPVGDLRWKAPQPVEPWEGVKRCILTPHQHVAICQVLNCSNFLINIIPKPTKT
ncbi:carboxylesterase family protein [Draconibacterium orientale]|uniref:carboxylesterase family protein n=1 Tax=Draconibacterium orientale TaxID=1168034 RepID=UPI0029BFB060|nr:carboxylesterase family protein [Draconibacterium orientale]